MWSTPAVPATAVSVGSRRRRGRRRFRRWRLQQCLASSDSELSRDGWKTSTVRHALATPMVENPGGIGGRTDSGAASDECVTSLLMASPVPRLLIRARDLTVGDKKLGGGAFGIVYQGKWNGLDVAVKITKMEKLREASPLTGEELTDSELMAGAMEDVLSEAQEMLCLRHPNVVQFLGVCTDAKHGLMIVSELCKGGSLDKYLAKNRPLPLDVRDRFVRKICEGVQYLHDHDIVHRALKPGNILLGEHLVIKISDFGMTRNVQVTSSSFAGGIKGTPNYMSPESLDPDNLGKPSMEADIWAVGCIIAQLFGGQQMHFQSETVAFTCNVQAGPPLRAKHLSSSSPPLSFESRPPASPISCLSTSKVPSRVVLPSSRKIAPQPKSCWPSWAFQRVHPVLVPPSPVSPVDVPSAGAPPGVHTSMASTVPGPPIMVHPAQVELVVAQEQTALPAQQPLVKTPPSAPQPQIKHADIFDAVRKGDEQSVHLLIERDGKDILDKRDESEILSKKTPFLLAAAEGHAGVMLVMYESKPDVLQQTDELGLTALHFAGQKGNVASVEQLLVWDPKLIGARSDYGSTPFMEAAREGHVDVMSVMYESKPDWGSNAMHLAAQEGQVAAVNKLMEWDPKLIDARNKLHGRTLFILAAGCGHVNVMEALLEWGGGALLDMENEDGDTPWRVVKNREIRKIMRPYKPASGPCCVIM
ncbi:unnamed protein product [Vitrella brassicaformis CCMP3155]|uniref:Protein kinase domain-containing protein n=1 Tax=Vitrella brassicaformis (strain CCMP3155) TaxID=1169540 RepID=A0A0G4EK35_VITBC|nr:unnamed protein product [Vitrella brassicaformis CCMP3155]|eukprot:CEL96908.1 unnamed protein product [Vitrella brassicaformis CCMP3155]